MITEDKVIEIFYMADEYSREFSKVRQKYSLDEGRNDGKRRRNKPNRMSDAEIMVILILEEQISNNEERLWIVNLDIDLIIFFMARYNYLLMHTDLN